MVSTRPVLSETGKGRLADLATASRDAQETARVARHRLEDAVLDAIDTEKVPVPEIARALGVSPSRVYGIIKSAYNR